MTDHGVSDVNDGTTWPDGLAVYVPGDLSRYEEEMSRSSHAPGFTDLMVALEVQTIVERAALWVAICGEVYGEPDLSRQATDGLGELWGSYMSDQMMAGRPFNALGGIAWCAIELLGTGRSEENSLSPMALGMVSRVREGKWAFGRLTADTFPGILAATVELGRAAAVRASSSAGSARTAAGVAASLISEVEEDKDVWFQAVSAHLDHPEFAEALADGVAREIQLLATRSR